MGKIQKVEDAESEEKSGAAFTVHNQVDYQ
jgi:hypothetical protein